MLRFGFTLGILASAASGAAQVPIPTDEPTPPADAVLATLPPPPVSGPAREVTLRGEGLVFRLVEPLAPREWPTGDPSVAPTVLCRRAPCTVSLAPGARLAVQRPGERQLSRVPSDALGAGPGELNVHLRERRGSRIAGGVLLGVLGFAGGSLIVWGARQPNDHGAFGGRGGVVVAGLVSVIAALVVGVPLLLRKPQVKTRWVGR